MSFLGLFDYPREICQLRDQMPKADRENFIKLYKGLPRKEKNAFKLALRTADNNAASVLLGEDLTKYHVEGKQVNSDVKNHRPVPGSWQVCKIAYMNMESSSTAAQCYEQSVLPSKTAQQQLDWKK